MPYHHLLSLTSLGPSLEGPLPLAELEDVRVGAEADWWGDSLSAPWEGLGGPARPEMATEDSPPSIPLGDCHANQMWLVSGSRHASSSPSQPAASLHLQFTNSLLLWSYLTPRTAPQVQERSETVAPCDRWAEGNLKISWRPHGSVKYTASAPSSPTLEVARVRGGCSLVSVPWGLSISSDPDARELTSRV